MAEKKAKIRFTEDRSGDGFDFKAGEVYELPLPSCKRWVRRNVASYVNIGDLEAANIPHKPKEPAASFYKGCDGVVKAPVPDLVPLDEPAKVEEPPKKTRTTKRK